MTARIVALMNQKGGVGKTTTAVNLGAALALRGHRVLLVDSDPQANLTVHLDVDPRQIEGSLYDVLRGDLPIAEVVTATRTPNLTLLPSHIDLSGAEMELSSVMGRETILREALRTYLDRDGGENFVLIDCPPSLGVLSFNALTAAGEVLIPLQTEWFAMQGMAKLMEVIGLVRRRLNPSLTVLGIAPCRVDARTRLASDVLEEVRGYFGDRLLRTRIRTNIRLAEAPGHGRTIFEYDPHCHGAEDYRSLAAEISAEEPEPRPEPAPPPESDIEEALEEPAPGPSPPPDVRPPYLSDEGGADADG
jgi:chromosome partitioning protein